ncbi:MAG: SDR family oxidoreductase [Actinobacteria bacterium]|nr:SDR family oxidoreductase [Actinomycetota bacterium]MBV9934444.1 SDR family oxidoreductase [Actinomycetota bacterium]
MELAGKVVVVTGGASGIGRAMCRRFAAEGPKKVIVADFDAEGATKVAEEIGGEAVGADVSVEADIESLVERTEEHHGPIDLFCSNAGVAIGGDVDQSDEEWMRAWKVNLMAHVYAARAVLPSMLARGEGYLLNTASAAGLLTNLGAAPYAVTKHAAVALAEWISITHGDQGIKVSCLCPQGVNTPMLMSTLDAEAAQAVLATGGVMEPETVAEAVVQGLRDERFLILPHPEVADFVKRKADDEDRWLLGMRRYQARVREGL